MARLIPSILRQNHKTFEVVVVDDASTDPTAEVVRGFGDPRIRLISSKGPPEGWMGKVHALYVATRASKNDLYLFLDADAEFDTADALSRMIEAFLAHGPKTVVTALARWKGGGKLLVSLLPVAILFLLPWPLGHALPFRSMTAMNGQMWLIRRHDYHACEPHQSHRNSVLEDVAIGRYLKGLGIQVYLHDFQADLSVRMYDSFGGAWNGFRRNAALLVGGTPARVLPLAAFWIVVVLMPLFIEPLLLLPLFLLKLLADRYTGYPIWVTALTPVSVVLGTVLLLHSLWSHVVGDVFWKGRSVSVGKSHA